MSFFFAVLSIVGGAALLTISAGQAVTLVRPPRSAWARRFFRLPWEREPLPARPKRRKQALFVAGWFMVGLGGFLQGLFGASAPRHTSLLDLAVLLMAFGSMVSLMSHLIRPRMRGGR